MWVLPSDWTGLGSLPILNSSCMLPSAMSEIGIILLLGFAFLGYGIAIALGWKLWQQSARNTTCNQPRSQPNSEDENLKQCQSTLQDSHRRFRWVLENMPVMLNAFDENGVLLTWNQECERVTGYTAAEVVGNPHAMHLFYPDPAYRKDMMADWHHCGHNYRNWEWKFTCKDGTVKTIAWSNIADEFPIPGWAWWGIGTDLSDLKQAQHEQQRALTLFQTLFDQTPLVAIQGFDQQGVIHYWNESSSQLYGIAKAEALGQPIQALLQFEQNPGSFVQSLATIARTGMAKSPCKYQMTLPSGKTLWIYSVIVPIRQNGQVTDFFCMDVDITEQKQAETALLQNQQRLQLALEAAHMGGWEWDIATNQISWDEGIDRILGLQPGTYDGKFDTFLSMIYPADRDLLLQAIDNSLHHGKDYEVELRFIRPHGEIRWIYARGTVLRNAAGHPTAMVGIDIDITERKQSELQIQQLNAALEAQNRNLETLIAQRTNELLTFINTLPDDVFVVERDTMTILFCNEKLTQKTRNAGYPDPQGKTIFECFPPQSAAYFAAQNRQVFETGEILHVEEIFPLPPQPIHVDTYKIPLRKPDGEIYALIGSSRNITELVEIRQALAERTEQLEAINHELESFSYSVSHDLRAPLRHINGFVTALTEQLHESQALNDPKVVHYLDVISSSSHRMGLLIDGLLNLSRVGRRPIHRQQVNITRLVHHAIQLVQSSPDFNSANIKFSIGELSTVSGDPALLQQVFTNLIDNAVKFSRSRTPARIEIGQLPDYTIYIQDNGVGFDMAYADQLFGAFQRLHSGTEFEGTGIGLAIVQRIVHRHGGTIRAESVVNQGTCFYLKFAPNQG